MAVPAADREAIAARQINLATGGHTDHSRCYVLLTDSWRSSADMCQAEATHRVRVDDYRAGMTTEGTFYPGETYSRVCGEHHDAVRRAPGYRWSSELSNLAPSTGGYDAGLDQVGDVGGGSDHAATGAGEAVEASGEPVPVAAHHHTAGWGGVPGQCGVECACGTTFDNFDTIAEAAALLDDHIAAANPPSSAPAAAQSLVQYQREREQGMTCGRCHKPTGNNHQGHYWKHCSVTKQSEVFHFCCPGDCDRATAWRDEYEKLATRFTELGITVADNNAYGVPPKNERWVSLLAAAKAMDDIDAVWGHAISPLVKHVPETPAPEVWSGAVPPGGYVCGALDPTRPDGICGAPVESEPCPEHNPETDQCDECEKRGVNCLVHRDDAVGKAARSC